MRSVKVSNRILLGSIAFGVSFFLSLIANRDFPKALVTGLITVPATYAGAIVVQIKQKKQKFFLQNEIQAISGERQNLEDDIYYLESSLNQLHVQISEISNRREVINREVSTLGAYRYQLEEQGFILQTQLEVLERQKAELNQSLLTATAEKQKTETSLNFLKTELKQLQAQVTDNQNEKTILDQEITNLKKQKRPLQSEVDNLQTQLQTLEAQRSVLNQSLGSLKVELGQLQGQVSSLKLEHKQLQLQSGISNPQKRQSQAIPFLEIQKKQSEENLSAEWTALKTKLTNDDIQIIKAIVEQNNPGATLKRIAEANITMPQLLIDAINERAIDTIGDFIIEPGSASIPPAIAEEYLTKVNKMLET
ncbi:tellurite resistance TerB C-terminal domain-containing protein [Coleofasciculus sp. H7-2]|uniref:tellurite resistance TerB C-terminal domain-containing protein n=1 Tax=Coleofasciculus sp. H7-2 TaxID=3351545 RepID=UPI00366F4EEB